MGIFAALALAAGAAAQRPAPKIFELSLVKGRVAAASDTIRVRKNDEIELRWSSDRPILLHLHGYDIERKVGPQSPATMAFKAHLAGRFPISEHSHSPGSHRAILYLEVHP
jgi:hypothetical protein